MKREKPHKAKPEQKQVHFDMDMDQYVEFEKQVYAKGMTVAEFFRAKAMEIVGEINVK